MEFVISVFTINFGQVKNSQLITTFMFYQRSFLALNRRLLSFLFKFTQIFDITCTTAWFTSDTG